MKVVRNKASNFFLNSEDNMTIFLHFQSRLCNIIEWFCGLTIAPWFRKSSTSPHYLSYVPLLKCCGQTRTPCSTLMQDCACHCRVGRKLWCLTCLVFGVLVNLKLMTEFSFWAKSIPSVSSLWEGCVKFHFPALSSQQVIREASKKKKHEVKIPDVRLWRPNV